MGSKNSRCIECGNVVSKDKMDYSIKDAPTCYACLNEIKNCRQEDICTGCQKIKGEQNLQIVCHEHDHRVCAICANDTTRICTPCLLTHITA